MKTVKTKSAWARIRKFVNDVHLWIGLGSGIIVILICLSGTLYVFNTELREAASPELYTVKYVNGTKPKNVEELLARVRTGTGGLVTSVRIPSDPRRSYQFMVRLKDENKSKPEASKVTEQPKRPEQNPGANKEEREKRSSEGGKRPSVFAVDQYSGEILGNISESKTATAVFMKTMFSLHRWLLLDKIEKPLIGELENRKLGSYISGTATILFTFGVITGIVIWFPQRIRSWKQGLRIKWKGSWKRTNHDLHNSLGFYACIFLFLMGITGPQWSFPWYRDGLKRALGTYQTENNDPPQDPVSGARKRNLAPLKISDYIAAADRVFHYKGDYSVSLPKDSTAAVVVTKNRTGFFASPAGDKLLLDQYTASVLKIDVFGDKPFNQLIAGSIKTLHIGDVYGMFTKIIYFFACMIATSLPITGTVIWLNKLKKKKKTTLKQAMQPAL